MRRTAPLVLLLGLSGCAGFGEFLNHGFSLPGTNPNIPMADSENVRRVLGQELEVRPLETEPGNVWPGPPPPEPTLEDIQQRPALEDRRGFPPTEVPGATPGLPAHRQPRPRGSSTPPGSVQPGLPELPPPTSPPRAPRPVPPPPRPGGVIQTPEGPGVDTGGTNSYRQLNTPRGPGAIVVPNGNGTSTVINPDGTVQTIPTPR
jgi:hypothetical protein